MHRHSRIALAAVLTCAAVFAPRLDAQTGRWAVASWSTADGMPSNVVLGIRQTTDGYLWMASYQGLVRFDGIAFRTVAEGDIPGIDRASFFALAADSVSGTLWAASESNGLARLHGGEWRVFTTRDGLTSDRLTALHLDAKGTLWVGTRGGVCTVTGGRVGQLPPLPGAEQMVTALTMDAAGMVWIGTVASGVYRWDGRAYTRFTTREGLGDDRVASLHAAGDGSVWVGGYGAGVSRIHSKRGVRGGAPASAGLAITRHATEGAAVPRRVNEIARDPWGALWLGADNGLFRLVDGRAEPVTRAGGRPLTQVDAIASDAEGGLWVGSRNGGLLRVRQASVRMVAAADGLPHDVVFAVDGDGAGGAWIATLGGVAHRDARGFTRRYTAASGALRDDVARDVLRDRRGAVWVATNGGLTRIAPDGRATTLTTADGLSDDRARALLEDRGGGLWVGTFNGLTEIRGGAVRRYGRDEGLADAYVLSVFEDRRGTVWVGTQSSGLFRLENGRFAPGPPALARLPVFRLTGAPDGSLWAGTSRGLARVRGDSVTFVGSREGLPGNAVFQALDDGRSLWLTGPWGIGRAPRAEVEQVSLGALRAVDAKHFGSNDGLRALEASSISRAWRAPDGALWFPTSGGVAIVDPRLLRRNLRPPPTHVEDVRVDGGAAARSAALSVTTVVAPPGTRKLEFRFTAPSFVAPEQVKFRYRLDGFDRAWTDAGTQRRAAYTNLSPGAYTFRVQARNEDGVWSATAASARVTIRPYVWQTRWFLAAVAGVLVVVVLVMHRLRVRVVTHAMREEMLRALSLRDDLTGLYNRRGLVALAEQQVRSAERARTGFAVVFVDMDGLKEINDTLGHGTGDRAIADAATLLRATFRDSDVVARLGGDEFAALVPDADTSAGVAGAPGGAEAACARLAEMLAKHNASAGRPYRVSLSVGVARFDPGAPLSLDALLEAADRAMYEQKRAKPRTPATPVRGVSKLP